MKLLRLSLILLLAVLLPVRGALAAAMLCAPAPAAAQAVAAQDHDAHAHHAASAGHTHHEDHLHAGGHGANPEQYAAQHAVQHGDAHATHQACNHCAAFCSLTPLADTGHAQPQAVALPAASFPPLTAQAARFERDGPERPPRTV